MVFLTPMTVPLEGAAEATILTVRLPAPFIDALQADRNEQLQQLEQRGGSCRPADWEAIDEDSYRLQFQWNPATAPHWLDRLGQPAAPSPEATADGALVRLAISQKPFLLPDQEIYGSRLRLIGVQLFELEPNEIEPRFEQVAELFQRPVAGQSPGEQLLRAQFVASFI
jgi:hypothetical protein